MIKKISMIISFICLIAFAAAPIFAKSQKPLIGSRYPALSPDGKQIAFSYLGDIWRVPVHGGQAFRLTDNDAYDGHPIWSPDGKWLAFTSDREGQDDVYLMPSTGGVPKRLTFNSATDVATDFSPDGRWILFQSNRLSMAGLFKVSVKGGMPVPVLDRYWVWTFSGKFNPNGKEVLFSVGMENRFWWRKGYRGANSAKLWVVQPNTQKSIQITTDDANSFWPNWSNDGKTIYFVSERKTGVYNIWSCDRSGNQLRRITSFKKGEVRWLNVARRVPLAVYERNFGIYLTDLTNGESHLIPIEAPSEMKANRTFAVKNLKVSEYQLSPDEKKIAAIARGEIFVFGVDGGYARNITKTPWRERDISWDSSSSKLVYVSDVNSNPDLYIISAEGNAPPIQLTHSEEDELDPKFSPDGKWIAYYRGKRQLRLIKPDGKQDHLLIEGDFGGRFADDFRWSPDSRFIAVVTQKSGNADIYAVNVESGKTIPLTNTAYDENTPVWAPDGKSLLFLSNRFGHSFPEFTGKWDIYQLHLIPEKPKFDEDAFEKLFKTGKKSKEEKKEKSKKKPIHIRFDIENMDTQTQPVTQTLGNDGEFVVSPSDTTTVYFTSTIDGKMHLWKTSLDRKKRGTYSPFAPSVVYPRQLHIDKKGKQLFYLSRGQIWKIMLPKGNSKSISFKARLDVDRLGDYEQLLGEVYYTLQHYYYDPKFHHTNWKKVYQSYRPVLEQVREDRDFYDYVNEMIGELNSSHSGIYPPGSHRPKKESAYLGATFRVEGQSLVLGHIFKDSPLYACRDSVRAGDVVLSINRNPISATKNVWEILNDEMGHRIEISVKSQKLGRMATVKVKPISSRAQSHLALEEWIRSRKALVKAKTHDQVAYIYMRAMGSSDLKRFLKELERDAVPRKGLILDIRYNFGGNVHDRVLQALMKPVYAKWKIRGLSESQQSTFGFANKPVVLVTNETTLSDGEMTANGFKTLHRGPIVGNTTYGWIIFTTGVRLMNGAFVRLPFWGCYTLDGRDLETQGGVKPDVKVVNTLTDDLQGRDPQLEKAIEVMLKKIGSEQ